MSLVVDATEVGTLVDVHATVEVYSSNYQRNMGNCGSQTAPNVQRDDDFAGRSDGGCGGAPTVGDVQQQRTWITPNGWYDDSSEEETEEPRRDGDRLLRGRSDSSEEGCNGDSSEEEATPPKEEEGRATPPRRSRNASPAPATLRMRLRHKSQVKPNHNTHIVEVFPHHNCSSTGRVSADFAAPPFCVYVPFCDMSGAGSLSSGGARPRSQPSEEAMPHELARKVFLPAVEALLRHAASKGHCSCWKLRIPVEDGSLFRFPPAFSPAQRARIVFTALQEAGKNARRAVASSSRRSSFRGPASCAASETGVANAMRRVVLQVVVSSGSFGDKTWKQWERMWTRPTNARAEEEYGTLLGGGKDSFTEDDGEACWQCQRGIAHPRTVFCGKSGGNNFAQTARAGNLGVKRVTNNIHGFA